MQVQRIVQEQLEQRAVLEPEKEQQLGQRVVLAGQEQTTVLVEREPMAVLVERPETKAVLAEQKKLEQRAEKREKRQLGTKMVVERERSSAKVVVKLARVQTTRVVQQD